MDQVRCQARMLLLITVDHASVRLLRSKASLAYAATYHHTMIVQGHLCGPVCR
jgi:hypothetical protein